MVTIRNGSHAQEFFSLLSVVGEYPFRSLELLGSKKGMEHMIHNFRDGQAAIYYDGHSGEALASSDSLLTIHGRSTLRSIRLTRSGVDALHSMDEEAGVYYDTMYGGDKLQRNELSKVRSFRIAETIAMCMRAGYEYRLKSLYPLFDDSATPSADNCVFLSKIIKARGTQFDDEQPTSLSSAADKTAYTRYTGLLCAGGSYYPIYNTRDKMMKWMGLGEKKAREDLELFILNTLGTPAKLNTAIMLGTSELALTLLESFENKEAKEEKTVARYMKRQSNDNAMYLTYPHILYAPLNDFGIEYLQLLRIPDWHEKFVRKEAGSAKIEMGRMAFGCDAETADYLIYSFLDMDVSRFYRLRDSVEEALSQGISPKKSIVVMYYRNTKQIVESFLSPVSKYFKRKVYDMSQVLSSSGVKPATAKRVTAARKQA